MRSILVFALTLVMGSAAMAQHRDERHRAPPRQEQRHEHRHGVNPWVAGAIGLGVLGAGTYYYNQQRRCWNEYVIDIYGRQVYDQYGRPMIQSVCE